MFALNGRNVLVTGGAGYLGTPVCLLLKAQGANVIIADRDADRLDATQKAVAAAPGAGSVASLPLDMADEGSILQCVAAAEAAFGGLHGLVVATAFNSGKSFDALDAETFDFANQINLIGSFILGRAAAEAMGSGGSIVYYSSMYGVVSPNPGDYPDGMAPNAIEYGVGKAGLNQMVRYMAGHYGRRNIRVNALFPGPFPHAAVEKSFPEFVAGLAERTMLGRIGRQDETAGAAVFLISDAASYITGQLLGVDGGWTAW
ncbi:SDR family NAD(P)-dependent oxidoreductase [Devosia sp.]|uniref:SDR family NAD(P)-dependent oxidoreductase n=1 Tax=Devosia sp. TaxID=1871048 RepID=UPI003A942596